MARAFHWPPFLYLLPQGLKGRRELPAWCSPLSAHFQSHQRDVILQWQPSPSCAQGREGERETDVTEKPRK